MDAFKTVICDIELRFAKVTVGCCEGKGIPTSSRGARKNDAAKSLKEQVAWWDQTQRCD